MIQYSDFSAQLEDLGKVDLIPPWQPFMRSTEVALDLSKGRPPGKSLLKWVTCLASADI